MKLPSTIERDLLSIESEMAFRGAQKAGVPRLRGLRASIEIELARLLQIIADKESVIAQLESNHWEAETTTVPAIPCADCGTTVSADGDWYRVCGKCRWGGLEHAEDTGTEVI